MHLLSAVTQLFNEFFSPSCPLGFVLGSTPFKDAVVVNSGDTQILPYM
jgi:hypothetical protein